MWRLLILASLQLAALAQSVNQAAVPGTVDGRVTNSVTGEPVAGATIRLYPLDQAQSKTTLTASSQPDGTFHFDAVNPGTYSVMAEHANFNGAGVRTRIIPVRSGQQISNISVLLNPASSISGTVIDDAGNPVPKAQVTVYSTYTLRGHMNLRRSGTATADEKGRYLVKNVQPARCYISAETEATKPEDQTRAESEDPKPELVRTFFPKALDTENATPLQVSAGQDLSGTDIQLQRAVTYHVRGKIGALSGEAVKPTGLLLAERGASVWQWFGHNAKPSADGSFDIGKVLPGSYTLWLISEVSTSTRLLARQDIDVGATDVNGIVLAILPPINLSGRITADNMPNVDFSRYRVIFYPGGDVSMGGYKNVTPSADGSFTVQNLAPGQYSVRLQNPGTGVYVQSITFNRQDITNTGVDLSGGGAGEIDIALRMGTGEVDVTVDSSTPTAPATRVVLVPETLPADASGVLFGAPQSMGQFVIKNVPPGRYYAFAVEGWSSVWQNPDFLREAERQASTVNIEENGRVQVQLSVISTSDVQEIASRVGLEAQ